MAVKVDRPIYVSGKPKKTKVSSDSRHPQATSSLATGAYTKPEHIRNLIEDYERAAELGYRPNQMLGIVFQRFDKIKQDDLVQVSKKLRHAIADCLRRHGVPYIAVGMHENDRRGGYGLHIHILLYLPENRFSELVKALTECLAKRSKKYLKELAQKNNVSCKERSNSYEIYQKLLVCCPASLPFNFSVTTPMKKNDSEQRLAYLCKSIDPNYEITFRGKAMPISEMDWRITGEGTKLQTQSNNRPPRPIFSAGGIHQTCLTPTDKDYDPILIDETIVPSIRRHNNIKRAMQALKKLTGVPDD